MIPVYYSTADDTIEFESVSALADWLGAVDDAVAIVAADMPGHTVRILFGDPKGGATVTEYHGENIVREPSFANRDAGARHWLNRVRAIVDSADASAERR